MNRPQVAPYGSWKSPITSELIVSKITGLGNVNSEGQDLYWVEMRPTEGGRLVLVRRTPDGQIRDITPQPYNVRTRVHEYGGRCYVVHDGTVYFSNFADQRLYRQKPGETPQPFTPASALRYADPILDRRRNRLICVCEDHTDPGRQAVNSLVSLDLIDGAERITLVVGNDFYSNPRLSPDGTRLTWLTWNHPNMPWDGTELWVAPVMENGTLGKAELVAGGEEESIFQPEWSPDGSLAFVSDRTGWWNLYRWTDDRIDALCPMQAEFGEPQWVFGMSTYGFDSASQIICTYTQMGQRYLASLDVNQKVITPIEIPYTDIYGLHVMPGGVAFFAGSPTQPPALVTLDLSTQQIEVLRRSSELDLDTGYFSIPEGVEFPTEHGLSAFGYYYPPTNQDFTAPAGELPPLLVFSHGGPTGASSMSFSLGIQYWTSRGFAVLDVNYGGSTGYGRAYRQRLEGQWGVVDVDDCVNGALYLAAQGKVDRKRLVIRGGSAGGYTTLSAITFRQVFKAGASHFGIGDLSVFVHDTHKFESRYLDRLVGPYPERKDLYEQRSPINYVDQIACPLILFQGLEDQIVPPNQAEMMFAAVRAKGLPTAYLPFEGEQHGFRKAENIRRALDAELYFYARVFGFDLADPVEPIRIENLD